LAKLRKMAILLPLLRHPQYRLRVSPVTVSTLTFSSHNKCCPRPLIYTLELLGLLTTSMSACDSSSQLGEKQKTNFRMLRGNYGYTIASGNKIRH
jgi:hypothetical protein